MKKKDIKIKTGPYQKQLSKKLRKNSIDDLSNTIAILRKNAEENERIILQQKSKIIVLENYNKELIQKIIYPPVIIKTEGYQEGFDSGFDKGYVEGKDWWKFWK